VTVLCHTTAGYLDLSWLDLALGAALVLLLGLGSLRLRLGIGRALATGALRTTVQLLLMGLVLKALFGTTHPAWVAGLALVMLAVAGREVRARQKRPFAGAAGFGLGTGAMFLSSFTVTVLALTLMIGPEPWHAPRYAIPLLGMLLGNTMNGVGLGLDRLTQGAWQQRREIEGRLLMGETWRAAIHDLRQEAIRNGMIPVLNALAAAGIVALPGMMTGQILAGADPVGAVKYQILIMFLIATGTGFGTVGAVLLGSRRLFDERQRLRLDRLSPPRD